MNKKGLVPFPGDPVLSPGCVLIQHRQESSSSPAGHKDLGQLQLERLLNGTERLVKVENDLRSRLKLKI